MVHFFSKVEASIENFWDKNGDFDILHFQWPEELFSNWEEPNIQELDKLKEVLGWWKKRAKLIITRHNTHPHYRNTQIYKDLYQIIYENVDGVIHMGDFSEKEYTSSFPKLSKNQKKTIIPHHLFNCFPDDSDLIQARRKLKIPLNRFVVLVFGALRDKEEIQFVFDIFQSLKIKDKYLLISCFPLKKFRGSKYIDPIIKLFYATKIRKKINFGFVPYEDVHFFFNASDILLIPRKNILNSGNIPLGFEFKKVVVGPTSGNAGEILRSTGNPTFHFDSLETGVDAVNKAKVLSQQEKGIENYEYAAQNWNQTKVGRELEIYYKEIMGQ